MERKFDRQINGVKLALIGMLSFGCGVAIKPVETPTDSVGQNRYSVETEYWKITRINSEKFMVTDKCCSGSYGGAFSGRIADGIEYLRKQGCDIKEVVNIAQSNARVDVVNSEQCLPELQ